MYDYWETSPIIHPLTLIYWHGKEEINRVELFSPQFFHVKHDFITYLKKYFTDNIDAFSGLDSFLAKHTSEDNASFDDILTESERKRQDKHAWLFEKESHQEEVVKHFNCCIFDVFKKKYRVLCKVIC